LSEQTRTRVPQILFWFAIFLLTATSLAGLVEPTYMLLRRIPEGYNEGWNAYWARAAWQGEVLYPSPGDAISNNYPPLSFYIVGALGRLIGDDIFAGRIISELSLLALVGSIWCWLRATGIPGRIAVFGSTLFLAIFISFGSEYVGSDDPQVLAHALVIAGATILWRFDFSRRSVIFSGLLIVLGVLTKHLLLPVPIALTAWLALYRRNQLGPWLLTATMAGLVAIALLWLSFGPVFFHDLLSSRVYMRGRIVSHARDAWGEFGWLLILASSAFLPLIRWDASNALRRFAAWALLYIAAAVVIGCLAAGGKGVERNAFFDTLIASTLAVSAGTSYVIEQLKSARNHTASLAGVTSMIVATCGVMVACRAAGELQSQWREIEQADAREAQTNVLVQTIRDLGSDATACEDLSLCYWAHVRFKIDFFNFGQKLATGALPPESCRRVFSPASVRLIQSSTSVAGMHPTISILLTRQCNEELRQAYVPVASSLAGTIFRPSSAASAQATP